MGSLLRIASAQVKDRGVYVCKATNEGGAAQAYSILDIERMYLMNITKCIYLILIFIISIIC